jgi:hypothetical protein
MQVLKYVFNQSRPEAARKADPGMPSSHANSLAFLSTYVSLASAAVLSWQSPAGIALIFGIPALAIFLVGNPGLAARFKTTWAAGTRVAVQLNAPFVCPFLVSGAGGIYTWCRPCLC